MTAIFHVIKVFEKFFVVAGGNCRSYCPMNLFFNIQEWLDYDWIFFLAILWLHYEHRYYWSLLIQAEVGWQ